MNMFPLVVGEGLEARAVMTIAPFILAAEEKIQSIREFIALCLSCYARKCQMALSYITGVGTPGVVIQITLSLLRGEST